MVGLIGCKAADLDEPGSRGEGQDLLLFIFSSKDYRSVRK